jgi:S1-C subfamily serine protease
VVKASPADSAGLRTGDIIIEVDGSPVESPRDVQRLMIDGPIERFMVIRVVRGGESHVVTAIPDELAAA